MKKKAQAFNAVGSIITLIVGVGVSVMVLIFIGALGGSTINMVDDDINAIGNNLVRSNSVTLLNSTPVYMAHSFIQTGTLTVQNGSATGAVIGLDNFSIDYGAGYITLLTPNGDVQNYNNTAVYLNYTWGSAEVRESVNDGIISGFEALEQTGDYLPIIVLAVVISLVLFLVLGFTAFGGKGNGSVL